MFTKLTLHERYYIFVCICLVWMVGYQSYKGHVKTLEEQLNIMSNYYRDEISKVSDELFDLKHKKKK